MAAEKWDYIGEEPTGKWRLTIDPGEGAPLQQYFGATREDVNTALRLAQASAARYINRIHKENPKPAASEATPPAKPPRRAPAPLTDAERFQVANDITSPGKVDQAVTRVIESVTGVPIETLRENAAADDTARKAEKAQTAASEFAQGEPDWFPSDYNRTTLVRYMGSLGYDHSNVEYYRRAYRELTEAGLLQSAPDKEDDNEAQPPARRERISPSPNGANGRPRSSSTGIRSSDVSGHAPRPMTRVKYTPEQIARMGKEEYKRLWATDPEFAKAAELYKPNQENGRRSK